MRIFFTLYGVFESEPSFCCFTSGTVIGEDKRFYHVITDANARCLVSKKHFRGRRVKDFDEKR